jgi:VWFA-related protein
MTPTHRAIPLLLLALPAIPLAQQQVQPQDNRPGWNDDAQPTPGRANIPTLHTRVQLVLQDITVTDAAGRPVTNLTRDDFHIFEDGNPQTIKTFEEHAPIDPAVAEQRAAELAHTLPPNTFTNYKAFTGGSLVVFLIDAIDQAGCGDGAGTQMHLRQDMIGYMRSFPLGTPYIIFQLDTGLHMVQDMTADRGALETAVVGKRDFPELTPQLSSDDPHEPAYIRAQRRRQILTLAMKELQRYLGGIPGHKSLVWFTGVLGLSLNMPDPTFSDTATPPEDQMYTAGREPDQMKGNPTFQAFLSNITDTLAQSRIGLYIMQGHHVPGSEPPLCDYPEGKERIAAIVDRGTHYYTLSYTPTNQNFNDRPRQFSVQLADPTLHLDYRRTYTGSPADTNVQPTTTPTPTAASTAVLDSATGPSISMQTAMGMGTIEPTQVVFSASATPAADETRDPNKAPAAEGNFLDVKFRTQGYRDYTVHFRVRANELKLTPAPDQSAYTGKLEFIAVVYNNQGQAVNGKRQHASVTFPNLTDPQLRTAEVTGDLVIQVPAKGSYFLRLGVHDTATDRVGAFEIPIDHIPVPAK